MLLLLTLYYLRGAAAAPLPDGDINSSFSDTHPIRSLNKIIWSCFTTILACTWLAIHPNVPHPTHDAKTFWSKCGRGLLRLMRDKVPVFLLALVVPEYILAWAIRQWFVAEEIARAGEAEGTYRISLSQCNEITEEIFNFPRMDKGARVLRYNGRLSFICTLRRTTNNTKS